MDNTALQLNQYDHLTEGFRNQIGKGRPKGARNKKSIILEQVLIPSAISTLETIPKSIREKYKEALSHKGLAIMDKTIDLVESTEKPIVTFNAAARLYDLTTPRQQNIQVESRSTVIRSQDMLEGLKLLKDKGNSEDSTL